VFARARACVAFVAWGQMQAPLKQIGFDRWVEYVGMEKEQERQEAMTVAHDRLEQQLQDSESEYACVRCASVLVAAAR